MKRIILLLLSLSCIVTGMEVNDLPYEYVAFSIPLAPLILPFTQQERKVHKEKENQRLMQDAQQMVAQKENLNTPLTLYNLELSSTILMPAVIHKRHQNVIELILSHGASLNIPDKSGSTPLKRAVTAKCASNVTYLLQKGAQLGDQKLLFTLCNPAHDEIAPRSTHKRIATLQALLSGGADPNEAGEPCLLDSLLRHFQGIIQLGSEESESQQSYNCFLSQRTQMIALLLQAGLNPFKKDTAGKSDWGKICESKNSYDSNLFEFAKKEIEKQKIK